MRIALISLHLFIILGFASNNAAHAVSWDWYIERGVQAGRRGDYKECLNKFQAALVEAKRTGNPEHQVERSLDNVAWAYKQLSDYPRAEESYKRLIELTHSDDDSLKLASLYSLQGKNDEACKLYAELFENNSRSFSIDSLSDFSAILAKLKRADEKKEVDAELAWLKQVRPGSIKSACDYVQRANYGHSDADYLKGLVKQLRHVYHFSCNLNNHQARVDFSIGPDGQVSNLRLLRTDDAYIGKQALNAVLDAAPFPPLPADLPTGFKFSFTMPMALYLPERTIPSVVPSQPKTVFAQIDQCSDPSGFEVGANQESLKQTK